MTPETRQAWANRLDAVVAWCAALLPVGIVVGNAGFEGLVALAGLAFLTRCALARRNPLAVVREEPIVLAWGVWWAVATVSVLVNGAGSKGLGHDIALVRYFLFVAAASDTGTRRPLFNMMARGLAAAVVLGAVNTLSAYALGFDLLGRPLVRYTGKLKEASRLAGLSAYASPFLLGWAASAGVRAGRVRAALFALCALSFGQVLQTRVRTALLGAAAGLAAVAAWMGLTRRGTRALTLAAVAFLAVGAGVFLAKGYLDPT
ncbi:MAG: hypothetical protein KKA60_15545, partial [Proteobacteria bacterium]|nr:hypothetical protein [Pseudomonadota bacterium]